ncbi:MAG TPA: hypothetical protein VEQ17_06645 [Steroidobacteraceae bacterium]|nr:hypothetical protein [Steroidobacteraceae bacterium]
MRRQPASMAAVFRRVMAAAAGCSVLLPSLLLAQQPGVTPAQLAQEAQLREQRNRLPDTPGSGRFPALKEETPSLPEHVVYRPAQLASLGSTKLVSTSSATAPAWVMARVHACTCWKSLRTATWPSRRAASSMVRVPVVRHRRCRPVNRRR